jgi:hypothetical protein
MHNGHGEGRMNLSNGNVGWHYMLNAFLSAG